MNNKEHYFVNCLEQFVVRIRGVLLTYLTRHSEEPNHGDNPPTLISGRAHCT